MKQLQEFKELGAVWGSKTGKSLLLNLTTDVLIDLVERSDNDFNSVQLILTPVNDRQPNQPYYRLFMKV